MTSSSCFHGVAQSCLNLLTCSTNAKFLFIYIGISYPTFNFSMPAFTHRLRHNPLDNLILLSLKPALYSLTVPISSPNILSIHIHHVFCPLDSCVYLFSIILPSECTPLSTDNRHLSVSLPPLHLPLPLTSAFTA